MSAESADISLDTLPEIDLRHFRSLTDDTGILQHATFTAPDRAHGYCVDDNARALIAALMYARLEGYDERSVPVQRFLSLLAYALNPDNGRFRNFMGYDRRWLEEVGSEDSHGRALWALGTAVDLALEESTRGLAVLLLHRSLPATRDFTSIRAWAFAILGLTHYLSVREDGNAEELFAHLGERCMTCYRATADDDWPWFESVVGYANGRIPHALLLAGNRTGNEEWTAAALRSLEWLLAIQTAEDGHLSIIGNDGWYVRDRERARFDQQPVEVCALVQACLAASRYTGDTVWTDRALRCFAWFLGENDLGLPVYDRESGGCHDGLHPDRVNANQGAESTLAWLLSLLALRLHRRRRADSGAAEASS